MSNDPHIEEISSDEETGPTTTASGKVINRAEKKSRKAISKLGLKPFCSGNKDSILSDPKNVPLPGTIEKPVGKITRVCVKKAKDILFVIQQPDVWKSLDSQSFVVFGEARVEDVSQQSNAMRQIMTQGMGGKKPMPNAAALTEAMQKMGMAGAGAAAAEGSPKATVEDISDAPEPEEKDVELVTMQTGCTKEAAVAALKKNKNDIVEAIMSFN